MSMTRPAACSAIMPGEVRMESPKTSTPSRMPATGSAALIPGSDACNGAALNALWVSQIPTMLAATTQYAGQVVSSAQNPCVSMSCTVSRVSASEMPITRPAAVPVSTARAVPVRRAPA